MSLPVKFDDIKHWEGVVAFQNEIVKYAEKPYGDVEIWEGPLPEDVKHDVQVLTLQMAKSYGKTPFKIKNIVDDLIKKHERYAFFLRIPIIKNIIACLGIGRPRLAFAPKINVNYDIPGWNPNNNNEPPPKITINGTQKIQAVYGKHLLNVSKESSEFENQVLEPGKFQNIEFNKAVKPHLLLIHTKYMDDEVRKVRDGLKERLADRSVTIYTVLSKDFTENTFSKINFLAFNFLLNPREINLSTLNQDLLRLKKECKDNCVLVALERCYKQGLAYYTKNVPHSGFMQNEHFVQRHIALSCSSNIGDPLITEELRVNLVQKIIEIYHQFANESWLQIQEDYFA